MRRLIFIISLLTATLLYSKNLDLRGPDGKFKKMFWAHYVPWQHPANGGFIVQDLIFYPLLKPESDLVKSYKKEMNQAEQSGIDGFFVDLVFNQSGIAFKEYFEDMFKAAEGSGFMVAACLDGGVSPAKKTKYIAWIVKKFGKHPNYPKVDNKPVVATYAYSGTKPEEWRQILNNLKKQGIEIYLIANFEPCFKAFDFEKIAKYRGCFDMLYMFSHYGVNGDDEVQTCRKFDKAARENNADYMACIWPGYIGGWLLERNSFYQPFKCFDQLIDSWNAVFKIPAPWVHLTTWNDHHETTMMPTIFDPGASEKINAYFSQRWRTGQIPEKSQVFFAYHREKIPGSILRIEALVLPGKDSQKIKISGSLLDTANKVLRKLSPKSISVDSKSLFKRVEWKVHTSKLAISHALVPEFQVNGHKASLPPIFLRTGWLENPVTIKAPFKNFSDLKVSAKLTAKQNNHLLSARVKFKSSAPVISAELWRNNRPIGPMTPKPSSKPLCYMTFLFSKPVGLAANFVGGNIVSARRKTTALNDKGFTKRYNSFYSKAAPPWLPVKMVISANINSKIKLTFNNKNNYNFTLQDILRKHNLLIGDKGKEISAFLNICDNNLTERKTFSPAIKNGTLNLKLWSREKFDNDCFYVRFETKDGKIFYSNIITPFIKSSKAIAMNILATAKTLESHSGATGKPGSTGYLKPVSFKDTVMRTNVHPACLRSGQWTFEQGNIDSLGERDIYDRWRSFNKIMSLIVPRGKNQKCLKLDGKTQVRFRYRSYPMTACTIEFDINPDKGRNNRQAIIIRSGWNSAFNFYLMPDGQIEVIRNHKKYDPVDKFISKTKVADNKWTKIRLTFDEKKARLYFDGKEVASKSISPFRSYGNCTVFIGAPKDGFKGRIDNIKFLSRAVKP